MKKLLVLLMALALFAGACGDDDDGSSPFQAAQDAADDDGSNDDGSGDDGSNDDGSNDDGSGDDGPMSGDADSEWCRLARDVEAESILGAGNDDVFTSGPDAIEEALQTTLDFADDAEDLAPDEIADDVETIFDGLRRFDEVLAEADYNFLQVDTADLEVLNDPAFSEAGERIQRYNRDVCGIESDIDLGGDDGTATDDSGDGTTEDTLPDGSIGDIVAQTLRDSLGLSEEQAQCLVDNLDLDSFDPENPDISQMFGIFEDCDIDLAQLGQ